MPTLFLICGLPGSGKTAAALAVERDHNAVRLASDEWMARIVGDGWDEKRREQVENIQWALAQRLLALGLNVVLESGFWSRAERQAFRAHAAELGAESKLIYCQASREELKRRLVARNANLPPDTFAVTPEQLDEIWPHFEPPGEDELSATSMDREEAARLYDRVLEHQKNGDGAAALALLDRILASYPAMAVLHIQRGTLLSDTKQFNDALASFGTALDLDPLQAEAHFGRGAIFQAQRKLGDALSAYDHALRIQPAHVRALNNRALALRQTGNLDAALESYDAAIDLVPDCPDFRFGKAMCLLQLGRFEEGWRLYEWRKAMVDPVAPPPPGVRPWRGEALAGKTLLIQAEQGLGDTIQFCRFAALGTHVVLQVQDRLTRLLETLPFPVSVIGAQSLPPPCDYHVMLMSLPFHRGDATPASVPYLAAESERIEAWRTRIGAGGLKIGISWQGEKAAADQVKAWDTGRFFPLALFQDIAAITGVRLISLQKDEGVEQLNQFAGQIETLGDDLDSGKYAFLDTAAAMANLDLVITADTAVAHLAGALGRPVWLAMEYAPDWRWGLEREDTPWYPTMRLFRQAAPGDWREPFDRMAALVASRHLLR